MDEQFYYNKCACNEYDALIRRQGLESVPGFVPGNTEFQTLRRNLFYIRDVLKFETDFRQSDYQAVMEHTRPSIKKRYAQAYYNIVHRRMQIGPKDAMLNTFVKFEKIPIGKQDAGKPARLIQFRSYEYLYTLKSYILAHSLALKNTPIIGHYDQPLKTVFTKLYDNPGIAGVLYDSWVSFKNPVGVCFDHSKFDGHYCTELLDLEHEYWNSLFQSKYLAFLLKLQLINKGHTQNGLSYKMIGHRASGEYTTSEGNSLMNYAMLVSYAMNQGVENARIHVNGDDSVIIVEKEYAERLEKNLDYFKNFNMQTENDRTAYSFQQISYCQTSPIRLIVDGVEQWRMVKDPYRTMSRMCYCETKYSKTWRRYVAGIALCELACDKGVPILQSWCTWLLARVGGASPIGSVDKFPARLSANERISVSAVSDITREDFCVAFGVTPRQQRDFEDNLAGNLSIDAQSVEAFIKKYQFFHLH
jgi:hypothetical protein